MSKLNVPDNRELFYDLIPKSSAVVRNGDAGDDFVTLEPTGEGTRRLEEIKTRRSKKSANKQTMRTPKPYENYNPSLVIRVLDGVIDKIKAGKFGKGMDLRDKPKIDDLVDAFMHMEHDLPNATKVDDAVRKLIQIGKSYYEYDRKQREFIPNETYDGLIARYRSYGYIEPTGIVPNSSKKTSIQYPTLHNNMDKAYVIRSGEPIPEGVKETDKVEAFLTRVYKALELSSEVEIELELSPKIDGVSLNGTISGDRLINPQTRGDENASVKVIGMDGIDVGEGVTENDFGIQYEAFVTYDDLVKASEYLNLPTPYVSCRHAAAGIVNRLCSSENDDLLQFISLYPIEAEGLESKSNDNEPTYQERMDYLENFAVVPEDMIERKIIKGNMGKLLDKIEKVFESYNTKRGDLSYAIDGMVITVVDDDYQKIIGRSGRTNNYQIALKFNPASAEAIVKDIHLDSGKKGYRTIQVDFEYPVFLDGVKYDHVPILSAALYNDLGLRVGSKVNVHRVGDVIPAITVIRMGNGKSLNLPKLCPYCGHLLTIKNKKLYCEHASCRGNLVGRILGFIEGIELDDYSDSFAEMIVDKFKVGNKSGVYVNSIADLFDLIPSKFEAVGVNTKLSREFHDKLLKAVKNTPDYVILGSIGIADLGPARAKMILKQANGWNNFIDLRIAWRYESVICEAVGYAVGEKIDHYMLNNESTINRDLDTVSRYMSNFTTSFDDLVKVGHTGITVSDDIKRVCEKCNFELVDGKSFDILITGSYESSSGKMEKARKNNIPIYSVEDFVKRYNK